ncbi:MAG: O-antigen ligase family protein [Candidatus Omnitrophota bacterium]|nr:O-antigen ligase family protein [Candidatus Omnitrophota bacterium]MDZ4241682.1 O-antigen ligase family protein [Candidatus Omnitrophota bacterium]
MGSGIIANLKILAPVAFYLLGVALALAAFVGKVRWALLLVAFLLPLRNVVEKLQGLPLGNQFLDVLFMAMIVGWFVSAFTGGQKKLFDESSLNWISIVLIVYTFISLQSGNAYLKSVSFFDISDPRVQDWKNFVLLPILFFITFNNVTDAKWVWRVFLVMCLGMFISGYYTSTQISWFSNLLSRAKISGTFQFLGPNEVGAFFNQYTMILITMFFFMKKKIHKVLTALLILLNIYCILFLYSRAAYAALAAGLFILASMKKRVLLIPLILVAVFWQVALPEKAVERIQGTTNEFGELEESAERRVEIWKVGLEYFEENPVFGIGLGVFSRLGYNLGDTHNIYVKLLVEQGLTGLGIFFILVWCFILEGWRLYRKGQDDYERGLGLGFAISIVVLMINNFFGNRWTYLELSGYLWIFAGLVCRLRALAETSSHAASSPKKVKVNMRQAGRRP